MNYQEILNQVLQIVIPAVATAIAGWFTYIGSKLKKAYDEKVKDETVKKVTEDAVKYVEQVYTNLHGEEKLQKAIQQTSQVLKEKGINISEVEIHMLIESAVYGLNNGLTQDTKEALKTIDEDIKDETKVEEEKTEENKEEENSVG